MARDGPMWLIGALAVVFVLSAGPAMAETWDPGDPEPSFAEWWNDVNQFNYDGFSGPNWDDIYGVECYHRWLNFDDADLHYRNGVWWNGDGYSTLEIEFTGSYTSHSFGWYPITDGYNPDATDPDPSYTRGALQQLWSGSATPGSSVIFTPTTHYWGFYYSAGGRTFYSDYNLNTSYNKSRNVQVFSDPSWARGYGWVLGWEDQTSSQWGHQWEWFTDPDGDTDMSDMGTISYKNPYTTSDLTQYEPDYQDLVVTFRRGELIDGYVATPGPVPEPATWVLLIATGAIGVIRRRRRT